MEMLGGGEKTRVIEDGDGGFCLGTADWPLVSDLVNYADVYMVRRRLLKYTKRHILPNCFYD